MSAAKPYALSEGAERLVAFMRANGDALFCTIDGDRHYWALTISGLPVEPRFVSELKAAGLIEPRFVSELKAAGLIEPAAPELVVGLPSCLIARAAK
jgi:hypothetical protein